MSTVETMRVDDDGAAGVGRGLGLCERRAASSGAVMKSRPRIEKRPVWRNNYRSSSKALDCLVEVALSPTAALDLSGRDNAGESVATLRTANKCGTTTTTPSRADGEGDEAKGKGKDDDDDDGRYWSCSSAMKAPEPAMASSPSPSPSPSPASFHNHRTAAGFYQQQQHQQQQHQQQQHQQQQQQQEEQQKERQQEQKKQKLKRGLSSSSWSAMSHAAGRSSSSSLRVHADQPHSKRFTPRFKSLLDISC